jgi:phosphate transport system substrate-binding protein
MTVTTSKWSHLMLGRITRVLVAVAAVTAPLVAAGGTASAADSHTLIQGSGSSWSANAVNQWIADVKSTGLQVVYTPSGDASGRTDFANRTSDFAVTSLGYQGRDPGTGATDTSQGRKYAYLPIVAGGTSFPYQIKVQGKQVRNLRLSGETLTKIFTRKITNWDDGAITKDNNGHALPSLPIIPVVQAEGSGATAQFTRYMATEYGSLWNSFYPHGGLTEYYPHATGIVAQNGSDQAMNYVSSPSANGSIGYVEYSYALGQNYPVAKIENKSGYFTLPTQYNVAVALTKAIINEDKSSPNYLLQNLDNVYTDTDPRTYALSSYSYMIIPTGTTKQDSHITTAKRQTISDFLYFSICQGQAEVGPTGYSPLPVNLVQAGFGQIQKLKTADPAVDITKRNVSTCHNPTFIAGHPDDNHLAQIAPQPLACDKVGAGPCADGVTVTAPTQGGSSKHHSGSKNGSGSNSGSGSGSGNGSAGSEAGSGAGAGSGTGAGTGASGGSSAGTTIDPTTGQVVATSGTANNADAPITVPTGLAGYRSNDQTKVLAPLAVLLLLLALVAPPLVARRFGRRGPR